MSDKDKDDFKAALDGCSEDVDALLEAVRTKEYIDSNFNQLSLSDMYKCKLQVRGGLGGSTNWLSITNEQAKAVHAILAGDRVLGHDPKTQIVDVWSIEDVQGLRDGVTDEQALEVLQSVEGNFDATEGTTYDNLRDHLQAMFPDEYAVPTR